VVNRQWGRDPQFTQDLIAACVFLLPVASRKTACKGGHISKTKGCIHARVACGRCRRAIVRQGAVAAVAATIWLLYSNEYEFSPTRRHITIENARIMKTLHAGRFENHGKSFRLFQRLPAPVPLIVCSSSVDSSAEISVREMRANIGEPDTNESGDGEFPRHLIQRAQEKIRAIRRDNYTTDRRGRPTVRILEAGE